jgi:magnesium-transporting ATPase (P-type)
VFSSTTVSAGHGVGVVVQTGMNTRVGHIARLLRDGKAKSAAASAAVSQPSLWQRIVGCTQSSEGQSMTPLQRALQRLGLIMGIGGIVLCIVILAIGLAGDHRDPNYDTPTW